jgi:hypothetical protein
MPTGGENRKNWGIWRKIGGKSAKNRAKTPRIQSDLPMSECGSGPGESVPEA